MTDIKHEIARAFVQLHVLHHAQGEEVFGVKLIAELGRHGYKLSPGTIYPLLHRLEAQGLLACREVLVEGRRRKCYRITPAGRRSLLEVRPRLRELVEELLEDAAA